MNEPAAGHRHGGIWVPSSPGTRSDLGAEDKAHLQRQALKTLPLQLHGNLSHAPKTFSNSLFASGASRCDFVYPSPPLLASGGSRSGQVAALGRVPSTATQRPVASFLGRLVPVSASPGGGEGTESLAAAGLDVDRGSQRFSGFGELACPCTRALLGFAPDPLTQSLILKLI